MSFGLFDCSGAKCGGLQWSDGSISKNTVGIPLRQVQVQPGQAKESDGMHARALPEHVRAQEHGITMACAHRTGNLTVCHKQAREHGIVTACPHRTSNLTPLHSYVAVASMAQRSVQQCKDDCHCAHRTGNLTVCHKQAREHGIVTACSHRTSNLTPLHSYVAVASMAQRSVQQCKNDCHC